MKSLFTHAKFQAPLATLRSRISDIWRTGFAAAGRYRPLSAADIATVKGSDVPYKGDIPLGGGNLRFQTRLRFKIPRPPYEVVDNLIVTPAGAGWKGGVLYERYSASKPGLRMLAGNHAPVKTVSEGFFIQSEHTDTFGDWTSEYLSPLARVGEINAPVFLPAAMAQRSYVQRDAKRLGIDFTAITEPLHIKKARVVRQSKVIRYWTHEELDAYRKFLNTAPPEPAPGSMVYLSRHGEASEVAVRTHPNEAVEAVVRARGGLVLRTGETDLEGYLAAANSAETVLLDHGSAGYNMVYWRAKRLIEFASDDWWMNSFVMFAHASGVRDITIIRSDLGTGEAVAAKTAAALDQPIET